MLKALSEEEPEKLSKLPKKQKTAFADFIRKVFSIDLISWFFCIPD